MFFKRYRSYTVSRICIFAVIRRWIKRIQPLRIFRIISVFFHRKDFRTVIILEILQNKRRHLTANDKFDFITACISRTVLCVDFDNVFPCNRRRKFTVRYRNFRFISNRIHLYRRGQSVLVGVRNDNCGQHIFFINISDRTCANGNRRRFAI